MFMAKDICMSGIGTQYWMNIEIMGKIGERLDEGQEKNEALINGFLDYIIGQVLKTDCSEPLVDDMGFLLDLYSRHCNCPEETKDKFYADILVNFMNCFEDLNEDENRILLDVSNLFSDKRRNTINIEKSENGISFIPSDDNKENMITLFNYINKEFVKKNEHGKAKYKK